MMVGAAADYLSSSPGYRYYLNVCADTVLIPPGCDDTEPSPGYQVRLLETLTHCLLCFLRHRLCPISATNCAQYQLQTVPNISYKLCPISATNCAQYHLGSILPHSEGASRCTVAVANIQEVASGSEQLRPASGA